MTALLHNKVHNSIVGITCKRVTVTSTHVVLDCEDCMRFLDLAFYRLCGTTY